MPSAVTKKEESQNLPGAGDSHIDPIGQIKQSGLNKIRNLEKRKVFCLFLLILRLRIITRA